MQTHVHHSENHYLNCGGCYLYFIRVSKTSSQRISAMLKLVTPLDFTSKDYCCGFSLNGLFLSALRSHVSFFFAPGLKIIKISRVTYRKIELI